MKRKAATAARRSAAYWLAFASTSLSVAFGADDSGLDIAGKLIPQVGLGSDLSSAEVQSQLTESITRFRSLASVVIGLAAMTCVFFLAMSIVKLGRSGDNDNERRRAIGGIAATSIALALLGGIGVYLGVLWGLLR